MIRTNPEIVDKAEEIYQRDKAERASKKTAWNNIKGQIFAVDFDGTIVKHEFPIVGPELPGAIQTLKDIQAHEGKVIIWTCRSYPYIHDMTCWLHKHGFFPDAINSNIPEINFGFPKIYADIYIDDRNLGGFPGWPKVREILGLPPLRVLRELRGEKED